jgi:hypothetical protein
VRRLQCSGVAVRRRLSSASMTALRAPSPRRRGGTECAVARRGSSRRRRVRRRAAKQQRSASARRSASAAASEPQKEVKGTWEVKRYGTPLVSILQKSEDVRLA